jgi:hypothetical protein
LLIEGVFFADEALSCVWGAGGDMGGELKSEEELAAVVVAIEQSGAR